MQRPVVDREERERQVYDRSRRQDQHVVHQRDRLVVGDGGARLFHDRDETGDSHLERRGVIDVLMQYVDRDTCSSSAHVEQARWSVEELVLGRRCCHPR